MLTLNVTSSIIHIILILDHSSPCLHRFRSLISPAVKEKYFSGRVKWVTHPSLAILDRSRCIFWLKWRGFLAPGTRHAKLPMICCRKGSWVCKVMGGGWLGSSPCGFHPAATTLAKGLIPKLSTGKLGEADSEQKMLCSGFQIKNATCEPCQPPRQTSYWKYMSGPVSHSD